jgi:hypothetical protein
MLTLNYSLKQQPENTILKLNYSLKTTNERHNAEADKTTTRKHNTEAFQVQFCVFWWLFLSFYSGSVLCFLVGVFGL